jgi:hypothetical protein
MGYSLFSSGKVPAKTPNHDDQSLGQQVGRIVICCTHKADASRWTKSTNCPETAEISGLLHFNIEYNAEVSVPLHSASVQIDVGIPVNEGPVPTVRECAPSSAITGAPVKQRIVDTTRVDPQLEVTTPFGGGKGSFYSHEVVRELENEHRWSFKASRYSSREDDTQVTRARFTWTRTLLEDQTGLDRFYDGAIVLHCEMDKPLVLRVKVEAQPWKWYHRAGSRMRDSSPIQPRLGSLLKPEEFAKLQKGIQEQILAQNLGLAATGRF